METLFRSNKIKILALFLLVSLNSLAQTCDVSYSIDSGKACIDWSELKVSAIVVTFPNDQMITIPTLGETRLNMEVLACGDYLIELIDDKKTIKTITIKI
jgi:hypothetical protein